MMRETGCDAVIVGRGCLGRPWLFRELAQAFDGREPDEPPRCGAIVAIARRHAEARIEFFGETMGMRQMRQCCAWTTKGFRGSAALRAELVRVSSLDQMLAILARLDPEEPFPRAALRVSRAKGGGTQAVRLPDGYLDERDDDTPPRSPHSAGELAAWEEALSGG